MTDPKLTPLQAVLRVLKSPDADAVQVLLDLLDSRYVRVTDADAESLCRFPTVHADLVTNGIPVDTAPAIAQVASEVNGVGRAHVRAPWNRWTLEQVTKLTGNGLSLRSMRGVAGMCPTTLDEVERRFEGSSRLTSEVLDGMLAELTAIAGKPVATDETKPRWDRRTLNTFLRRWAELLKPDTRYIVADLLGDCDVPTLAEVITRWHGGDNTGDEIVKAMLLEPLGVAVKNPDPLLTELVAELDAVWGPEALVDINVEYAGDYVLVLRELIAMAQKSRGNHHTFELNGHIEAGGFVAAADPSQWTNGLHKPTLDAVTALLCARNRELCAEHDRFLGQATKSGVIGDLRIARLFDAQSALDEVLRLTTKVDNLSRPEAK